MKKQIIRLTENDLHRIIKESVRRVINENSYEEGKFSNTLKTAALGATLSMSPMQGNASTLSNAPKTEITTNDSVNIGSKIKKCTIENQDLIQTAEDVMKNGDDLADAIKNACVMDELDNYIRLEKGLTKEDKQTIKELSKTTNFAKITIYDEGQAIPNCLVDIEQLKDIMSNY